MTNMKAGTMEPAGAPAGMRPAEWETRCELAACYQLTDLYRMSDLAGTHISARVPGPEEHFLLNPFGYLFDEITASSLIKVDVEGNVVSGKSEHLNFAGFVIHSAIHIARPDLLCVMHTHTDANNAVAMLKEGLMPLTQKATLMRSFVRYHDFEGAAFNIGERERIVRDMGDGRCMLLRNHGALTVGRSIGEAFSWMYMLEIACRQQVAGLSCNRELTLLASEAIEHTQSQGRRMLAEGGHAPRGFEWPALVRKLERDRGLSYRT